MVDLPITIFNFGGSQATYLLHSITHMRSVESLLSSHFILATTLVVHERHASPPTHTMRGSAHGIVLSIRLPSHL